MPNRDEIKTRPVALPRAKPAVKGGTPAVPAGKKPPGPAAKKPVLPPGARGPGAAGNGVKKKTSVETIKAESYNLRGSLAADLDKETDHFDEAGRQVLKFHGIYQQDDRDQRQGGKEHIFMIRSKLPGGRLTAEQYLAHETLADHYADGTLRITTRQDFQLHGVIKSDLKATLRALNEHLVTTLGACGDLVRNVVSSPVPTKKPYHAALEAVSQRISDHFLPQARAYHEVWLDGEKVYNGQEQVETKEPIYGRAFLPRKFKIGIAYPGDNSIDVYTQDVGLIAVVEGDELAGFNLLVGGGLGMTHKKPETFPRLADPLAFITKEEVIPVLEHIVGIHRDHGDRTDRKHARLKYLIHDWGLGRFRRELEGRLGYRLKETVPVPPLALELYLGWHEQGDGRWYLGLSVENGRVKDEGPLRLKSGLHAIIDRFCPGVRLTPNQDILLTDLRAEDRPAIEALLQAYGIRPAHALSNARRYAMACPALPTCGLAIAESERVLPAVIDRFEEELARLGLQDEQFTIRMTGCPNGCARPYVADVGFVGRSLNRYMVFVGGRMDGSRLNRPFRDLVPLEELVDVVRPLLVLFKQERQAGESFGDFCHRVGVEALQVYAETYEEYVQLS